jgi:hypothetical protein
LSGCSRTMGLAAVGVEEEKCRVGGSESLWWNNDWRFRGSSSGRSLERIERYGGLRSDTSIRDMAVCMEGNSVGESLE